MKSHIVSIKQERLIINHFLQNSQLPTLDEAAANAMDVDITLEEIQAAISQFPNNKAPGPDRFTS